MAKIITVTNQKGGVGKTTVTAAFISELHRRGARVLGVDIDPQGNLGFSFGLDIEEGLSVYDVLTGKCSIMEAIVPTEHGDILHTDIMLSAFVSSEAITHQSQDTMLGHHLELVAQNYDYIFIDTPPSLNLLTINAYVASSGLIIPMKAEVLSLVGISQIQDTVEAIRKSSNPHLQVYGIVMNEYNPRLISHREILDMVEELAAQMGTRVFPTKIRRGVDVATAPAHGQSVMTFRPKSNPAMDLRKLVDAVAGEDFPRPRR